MFSDYRKEKQLFDLDSIYFVISPGPAIKHMLHAKNKESRVMNLSLTVSDPGPS